MKNKKVVIVSLIVLLVAIIGTFGYEKFVKDKPHDGSKTITVTVIDSTNNYKKKHKYHTDRDTLGDVLEDEGLIEFKKFSGARFITAVDGIKADSDKQQWWNLTVNGNRAETGIDDTMIKDGENYELTLTVGW